MELNLLRSLRISFKGVTTICHARLIYTSIKDKGQVLAKHFHYKHPSSVSGVLGFRVNRIDMRLFTDDMPPQWWKEG